MTCRSLALIIAALSSAPIAAAHAQSVYVAPGGVYIGAGPVYVTPAPNGVAPYGAPAPTVAPVVVAPPGYGPSAVTAYETAAPDDYEQPAISAYGAYAPPRRAYGPPAPVYGPNYVTPRAAYVVRPRTYATPPIYAADDEYVPRPPAAIPGYRYSRCNYYGSDRYCD